MMNKADVVKRFDWNNRKAMNKERLLSVYLGLTEEEQAEVYKHLKPERKELLSSMLARHKQQEQQHELKNIMDKVHLVFADFIDDSYMKDYKTAALIITILFQQSEIGLYQNKSNKYFKEKDDFLKDKQKMLEWINLFIERTLTDAPYNGPSTLELLRTHLEELDYIPVRSTRSDLIKEKRELFNSIFVSTDIASSNTSRIVRDIIGYIEWLHQKAVEGMDLGEEYSRLYHLVRKAVWDEKDEEEVIDMLEQSKLYIDKDSDSYVSVKLKIAALKSLLPEAFLRTGKEFLRVHSPVEFYSVPPDLCFLSIEDSIEQERELFESEGKTFSQKHRLLLEQAYETLKGLHI